MPRKTKQERSAYMREYRARQVEEVASLEGEALDPKIEEYRKQGLNKNSTLEMIRRYTQALGFEDVWLRGML
jgi:hypothetical protein